MRVLALFLLLSGCASPMMPSVEQASPTELQALACGEENASQCGEVVAVYDHVSQTMYLPKIWTKKELTDYRQSVLVHEFVHHVQGLRGEHLTKCSGDREREAYQAQMAYLKAKGHEDPMELMGIGPIMYMAVTTCGWN
jgi:hypothetical protein